MNLENKRLTSEPLIHEPSHLVNAEFGKYVEIGAYNYMENVEMGDYSYTGQFCFLQNARIGRFSNIAAMVRIGPTHHPLDRPTLHHFTYRRVMYGFDTTDDEAFFQLRRSRMTNIGHDTWIGHGAIIMPGVTVGNGAVVGSGAVVTKDVQPYSIVAEVPARIIRYRFPAPIVGKLEAIRWWDWTYDVIKERIHDFSLPIEQFIEKYDR